MKVPSEVKTSTYIMYTHAHARARAHTHTHTHTHYVCPYKFTCIYPFADLIGDHNVIARADMNSERECVCVCLLVGGWVVVNVCI